MQPDKPGYSPELEAIGDYYARGLSLPEWYRQLTQIQEKAVQAGLSAEDGRQIAIAFYGHAIVEGDGTSKNPITPLSNIAHPEAVFLAMLGSMYLSGKATGFLATGGADSTKVKVIRQQKPDTSETISFQIDGESTVPRIFNRIRRRLFSADSPGEENSGNLSYLFTRLTEKLNDGSKRSVLLQKDTSTDPNVDSRLVDAFTNLFLAKAPSIHALQLTWESIGLILVEAMIDKDGPKEIPQGLMDIIKILSSLYTISNDDMFYKFFQWEQTQERFRKLNDVSRSKMQEEEQRTQRVEDAAKTLVKLMGDVQEVNPLTIILSTHIAQKIGFEDDSRYTHLTTQQQNELLGKLFEITSSLAEKYLS